MLVLRGVGHRPARGRTLPTRRASRAPTALALRDRRDAGTLAGHGLAVALGRLDARTNRLLAGRLTHPPNRRLLQHLRTERPALFTCLCRPDVEATNWQAEQAIRPAVVTRKVCGGNRTPRGAATQSIVASVLLPALRISAAPRMAAYALGARASQAQEPVRPRLAETIGKQELA